MHRLFRVLGQQMGIQQVRGILPESIDVYLNDSIIAKVRAILQENCTVDFKNKLAIQQTEVSPINALRTLYYESSVEDAKNVLVYLGGYLQHKVDTNKRYACRMIDPIKLDNTLNDYCNKPSLEYPIMSIVNKIKDDAFELNIGFFTGGEDATDYDFILKYLTNPDVVKFVDANSEDNVDCNIPEYLHAEIVEKAVRKYFTSLGYTMRPATNEETTQQ